MSKLLKNILYSLLTTINIYLYLKIYVQNIYLIYILSSIVLILLFLYYSKLDKDIVLNKKYKILIIIISILFTIFYSYDVKDTLELFFNNIILSIIMILGHYFFYKVLIYYLLAFLKKEYKYSNKLIKRYSKHPFIYSFIFLSICYGIYLIMYYPGIINYDNANQIKEVMGIHTRYIDAIIPVSSSMLTNFNPIIHTIILGGLFKFGYNIGNVNFGLFLYSIFQLIIVISSYSYTLSYSIKKKINPLYSVLSLLLLGILPIFGFYSITAVKDVLYTSFVLLFSLKIYDIVNKKNLVNKDYLWLFIISLLVCLFRNNGILIILVTLPFIIYKNKKILMVIGTIIVVFLSFNKLLLLALGVSGTSVREVLSIPFQQTARVVKYHDNDINDDDKKIIEKILDYKNLKKDYDENLADPVKNKFNKYSSKEDLKNYLLVWGKYFIKYPSIYTDAYINNVSGYFNPFTYSWKVYHKLNPKLPKANFDYHYNKLELGRNILYNYEILFEVSPLGILVNIAFISWLSILLFIKLFKNKSYIFLIPNMISIFFCLLSPANTYFRYIYPSLVILIVMFPIIKKECEKLENIE